MLVTHTQRVTNIDTIWTLVVLTSSILWELVVTVYCPGPPFPLPYWILSLMSDSFSTGDFTRFRWLHYTQSCFGLSDWTTRTVYKWLLKFIHSWNGDFLSFCVPCSLCSVVVFRSVRSLFLPCGVLHLPDTVAICHDTPWQYTSLLTIIVTILWSVRVSGSRLTSESVPPVKKVFEDWDFKNNSRGEKGVKFS